MGEANTRSYENLANAIILLAVSDYRAAQKKLRGFPTSRDALAVCREVRRFFLSAYLFSRAFSDFPAWSRIKKATIPSRFFNAV